MNLAKIDLGKIDFRRVINNYKNKIANVVLVTFALSVCLKIFMSQNKIIDSLKQAKEIEMKKSAVLSEISISEKKISLYKNIVNKKDVSSVINIIANVAKSQGFKITSLNPGANKSYSAYEKYSFNISGIAKNYNTAMEFIKALENDPSVFIIESINVMLSTEQSQRYSGDELSLDLGLYTVLFK